MYKERINRRLFTEFHQIKKTPFKLKGVYNKVLRV